MQVLHTFDKRAGLIGRKTMRSSVPSVPGLLTKDDRVLVGAFDKAVHEVNINLPKSQPLSMIKLGPHSVLDERAVKAGSVQQFNKRGLLNRWRTYYHVQWSLGH